MEKFYRPGNKIKKIKAIKSKCGRITELEERLIFREDVVLKTYKCSMGYNTIGIGHARNVRDDMEISLEQAMLLLREDIENTERDCRSVFGREWVLLDRVRQDAIKDMMFNLGITKFKKWKRMIKAIKTQDWDNAWFECAYKIEKSRIVKNKYHTQVGSRASKIALELMTGDRQGLE